MPEEIKKNGKTDKMEEQVIRIGVEDGIRKIWGGIKNDFIVFKNGNVYTKQYLSCDNDGNILPELFNL